MKKVSFEKFNGAGNDFVIFDRVLFPQLKLSSADIRKVSDRKKGIGADGVMVIGGPSEGAEFSVEYYNADGSGGMLCGNGARCAVSYSYRKGYLKNKNTAFSFNGAIYDAMVNSEYHISVVILKEYDTAAIRDRLTMKTGAGIFNGCFINTGAPHAVINIGGEDKAEAALLYNEIEDVPVFQAGRSIRYDELFQPEGTNVNFYIVKKGKVFLRTYERGVEDETLACGTGATATAIAAVVNSGMKPPVEIVTFGGDTLQVDMQQQAGNGIFRNVTLSGPAELSFSGVIELPDA